MGLHNRMAGMSRASHGRTFRVSLMGRELPRARFRKPDLASNF
jgi:hypothetical protein